jgi:hypothetical protein
MDAGLGAETYTWAMYGVAGAIAIGFEEDSSV